MDGFIVVTKIALVGFVGLAGGIAGAQGYPISTDRPSFSDGTLIIPKGRWQIESGYTYSRAAGVSYETFGELLLRMPVADKLELRLLNFTIGRTPTTSGLVDPSLGLKFKIQDGTTRRPDLAFVVQSTVPAGASAFRVGRSQPTVKLAWYQQSDSTTGFGGNFVVADLGPTKTRFTQYAASLYVSKTLSATTGVFGEVYGIAPISSGGPNAGYFDIGATYLLNQATQVDIRFGSGFNQSRDGWFVGAGIGYRF